MELTQPSPSPFKVDEPKTGEQSLQDPYRIGNQRVPSSSESSYVSTTGTRTPRRVSTSGTNTSPSKAFMTLTPIKLPEDYSPSKNPLFCSSSKAQVGIIATETQLDNYSPTHETMYKEKFNGISEQLSTLLGNLNVIYQKIGYTSSDITSKEKFIFNKLSTQLKTFYDEAEDEMSQLSTENENDQEILNRILVILGDPSGIETIPDLYIRNAILKASNKKVPQSPKKELTLLNKKASLTKAKTFTLKVYIPKLITFLQKTVLLQKLLHWVGGEHLNENMADLINTLPSLQEAEPVLNDLKHVSSPQAKDGSVSYTIRKYKSLLFDGVQCADVSKERILSLNKAIEMYQNEILSRRNQVRTMIEEIDTLLNELDINPSEDLPAPLVDVLTSLSQTIQTSNTDNKQNNQTDQPTVISQEHLETLQQILDRYLTYRNNRVAEKKQLITSCQKLWEMLKIPESYTSEFIEQNKGLSLDVFAQLKVERERLEKVKQQQIKQLITEALAEINSLWDTLSIESEHRDTFFVTFNQMFESAQGLEDEENVLGVCNAEVKEMKEKMKLYEPVLKLIDEFYSLKDDEQFLENSSKDSSRLLSRNSHKILLKEETIRKRLTRHFPRVFAELSSKLVAAEDSFQRPFLHDGQPMLDIVLREEEAFFHKYPRSRRIASGERVNRARKERVTSNSSATSTVSEPAATLPSSNKGMKPHKVVKRFHSDGSGTVADRSSAQVHRGKPRLTEAQLAQNTRLLAEKPVLMRHNTDSQALGDQHTSRLLAPTRIMRTPGRVRPTLGRANSTSKLASATTPTVLSTPRRPGTIASHGIVPTQLFPMSESQLNHLHRGHNGHTGTETQTQTSRIPGLGKPRTIISSVPATLIENKENAAPGKNESVHSPYREPEHSVYQLSQSPDGKYKLSIQQRALDNPFDDTSLLEE